MNKALVIGVILLFLGVGFQPALANEISTNTVSDIDEDCLECQPVNRVDLLKVKLLLIRVEIYINIILSKFGHIPEIREKCNEILDVIHKNRVSDFNRITICIILYINLLLIIPIGYIVNQLWIRFKETNPIIAEIIRNFLYNPLSYMFDTIDKIGYNIGCWD